MIYWFKLFFKRFFHIHDYGYWEIIKSGPVVDTETGKIVGNYHDIRRVCKDGWRWFIRLSRNTDRQKSMTNELRKQVQVYLEYPKAGW